MKRLAVFSYPLSRPAQHEKVGVDTGQTYTHTHMHTNMRKSTHTVVSIAAANKLVSAFVFGGILFVHFFFQIPDQFLDLLPL